MKRTHEQFIEELKVINPNVEILGKYVNCMTKIKVRCLIDDTEWDTIPMSLLKGHGCPKCGKLKQYSRKRKTHEEFVRDLNNKNPNILVLGKYVNARTKISVQCKLDNHIWQATPDNLLSGNGCPMCAGKVITTDSFKEKIKQLSPHIEIYGEYINNVTKMDCYCTKHNYNFFSTPANLLDGKIGCPHCRGEKISNKSTLSQEEFEKRIFEINPKIQILTNYVNAQTKVDVQCKECTRKFKIIPNNAFHRGIHCTCEKRDGTSKGERIIYDYLIDKEIMFSFEHAFSDLTGINGGVLTYDFYLPNNNLLIEFQGEQHEHVIAYFGGEEKFQRQQEHDRRKRAYAKLHKIDLLEIWYYDIDNIVSILNNKFNNINLQKSA